MQICKVVGANSSLSIEDARAEKICALLLRLDLSEITYSNKLCGIFQRPAALIKGGTLCKEDLK